MVCFRWFVSNMAPASKTLRTRSHVKGKAALKVGERESPNKKDAFVAPVPIHMLSEEPFNLEGIPLVLSKRQVDSAPCLLERRNVIYNVEFFHRICGLCMEAFLSKEVSKAMVLWRVTTN